MINLSNDKDAVLREAFRVLKPGGRFAVSDVIVRGDVPDDVRRSVELWVGCIAGALEENAYVSKLQAAGFSDVEIDVWRVYNIEDARSLLAETGLDVDALAPQVKDRFASAFIRARKPAADGVLRAGVLLMMRLSLALAMLAGSVVSSYAQDPYAVAPHAYKKQFENEFVRVTRVHYAPHEQLTEHGHPARPTIYIYLTDGGPVLFKHEHGDSGAMAATRPATKAGAYRIALGRNETHVVDNQSDLPSDFLQVELKTDIDPKTFNGRRFRDPADAGTSSSKVEFDTLTSANHSRDLRRSHGL